MDIMDISQAWIWFRKCKSFSDRYPQNPIFENLTMVAYGKVLMVKALYFQEIMK